MTIYKGTLKPLQELRETLTEDERLDESAVLHWVKQKYGAAKAMAHRAFLKMVRKDPAGHRRKMRQDKRYHQRHKWHDALMRRTARKGWARRRVRRDGYTEGTRLFSDCFGDKAKLSERLAPQVYAAIDEIAGKKLTYPRPVQCMTEEEIASGRKIKGPGHEGGAGHGMYVSDDNVVKINAGMDEVNILANFIHENLHFALRGKHEVDIDSLTDTILNRLLPKEERDVGQAYMDLPFELRVTSGAPTVAKEVGDWTCPKCGYEGMPKRDGSCPKCGAKMAMEMSLDAARRLKRKLLDLDERRVADPRSMKVQSLIFAKDTFSRGQAVRWAKGHGFKADKVDEKANTWRIRQRDPGEFETFRTITFKPGLKAVVAKI